MKSVGLFTLRIAVVLPILCMLLVAQRSPVIKATPSRVKVGEILHVTGTGFVPDRTVVSHLLRPDKTEYQPLRLRPSSTGELVHKIDTVMLDIGTFEIWIEDESSRITSNRIQFIVDSDLR